MIEQNNLNSNFAINQVSNSTLSNTRLFPLPSQNSTIYTPEYLHQFPTSQNDINFLLYSHLDYLTLKYSNLFQKDLDNLFTLLGIKDSDLLPNTLWYPASEAPKSSWYKNKILSPKGLIGGYTKKKLNSSLNTLTLYDVMIVFKGTYLTNLTPTKQIKLLRNLSKIYSYKCTRIDLAIDDFSHQIIPVIEMYKASLDGNKFGFINIDDDYLKIIHDIFFGTLGFGSRESGRYVRIYNNKNGCIRLETEYKKEDAQQVFWTLANLKKPHNNKQLRSTFIQKTIALLAIEHIDFRDKNSHKNKKKATKQNTVRLPFHQQFVDTLNTEIYK